MQFTPSRGAENDSVCNLHQNQYLSRYLGIRLVSIRLFRRFVYCVVDVLIQRRDSNDNNYLISNYPPSPYCGDIRLRTFVPFSSTIAYTLMYNCGQFLLWTLKNIKFTNENQCNVAKVYYLVLNIIITIVIFSNKHGKLTAVKIL